MLTQISRGGRMEFKKGLLIFGITTKKTWYFIFTGRLLRKRPGLDFEFSFFLNSITSRTLQNWFWSHSWTVCTVLNSTSLKGKWNTHCTDCKHCTHYTHCITCTVWRHLCYLRPHPTLLLGFNNVFGFNHIREMSSWQTISCRSQQESWRRRNEKVETEEVEAIGKFNLLGFMFHDVRD